MFKIISGGKNKTLFDEAFLDEQLKLLLLSLPEDKRDTVLLETLLKVFPAMILRLNEIAKSDENFRKAAVKLANDLIKKQDELNQ
jgi:hypothetical protein